MTRIYDTYRRNHDRLWLVKMLVAACGVLLAGLAYGFMAHGDVPAWWAGSHAWWR